MQIYTASEARKNLFKLIDQTNAIHEPITITSKRKNVVVIAEDDWRSIQETMYLMSNKELWKSIIDGIDEPIGKCINLKDFKW